MTLLMTLVVVLVESLVMMMVVVSSAWDRSHQSTLWQCTSPQCESTLG